MLYLLKYIVIKYLAISIKNLAIFIKNLVYNLSDIWLTSVFILKLTYKS